MKKQQKQVAILYIALGRYICFWKDFYESCESKLLNCDKHYFVWTDNESFDYSNAKNVTVIPAKKMGWPYDTVLRFEMFLGKEQELKKYDYIYFFNANMQFINYVDLAEIAPQSWHTSGIVAGIHPGHNGDVDDGNIDGYQYERRPQSTAYIPFGHGKHYVCGAFNGGTSDGFLKMCKVLAKNVRTDLDNGIEAIVDDESHLNWYVADKDYLLAGRAYGFPEGKLKYLKPGALAMVKIISRHKEHPKYGGARYLRGQTDRKTPNNFMSPILIGFCRVISVFIPNRKLRQKVRTYFGSY
ncbi:MAG: glycosyl transferase [Alphaproteobacteria bacterium]|nr:glycosyl transferase [Alphaproteobacteria bacterium]